MTFQIQTIAHIEARLEPWHWLWAESNQQVIDAHWDRLLRSNSALYDGEVLMMHQGDVEDGIYHARYFKTRFSRFIAWRDWGCPDPLVRNGFAMTALMSQDGAYLLGVMGEQTSNAGKMYFPAGTPDLSDVKDGLVDLQGSAVRELTEETGFEESDLAAQAGWTLIEGRKQVAYLRHGRLHDPLDVALQRFTLWHGAQQRPELAGLYPVTCLNDLKPERMHDYLLHWFREVMPA